MLTLHGFAYSNYFNIVKHVLLAKDIPFRENTVYPNVPELLACNPVGKVPALTTESGAHLAESSVLVDYLEEAYPQPALFPVGAEERARTRQLMKISELYLDLPARRLLPAVFANATIDQEVKDEVRANFDRGVNALNALASFKPYVAGERLSAADIYLRYALVIPKIVGPAQLNWNILTHVKGLADWDALMADSDISRKIDADLRANETDFMAYIAGRLA
jgi:glutathione S-transferase